MLSKKKLKCRTDISIYVIIGTIHRKLRLWNVSKQMKSLKVWNIGNVLMHFSCSE